MCFEYYERLQRQGEQRRRELLELEKRPAERDHERPDLDQTEWVIPEEPARARDKVPA